MKVIQIEYPDKNVHKVVVSEYNHSNDTNLDYINYYDLANDRNMYSILKEAEGKIFNDTELYDFTYNELIRDIERKDLDDLPSIIPLYMENENYMPTNRLEAFYDAIIAIIVTVLVLELPQPETASIAAIWL